MKTIYYFENNADNVYQAYQKYYAVGLRDYSATQSMDFRIQSLTPFPGVFKVLQGLRRSRIGGLQPLARFVGALMARAGSHISSPGGAYQQHVGQYILCEKQNRSGFVIDANDFPEIRAPELLDWCQVYFKSNWWPSQTYPEKVRPIINGNPNLVSWKVSSSPERVALLRSLRSLEQDWDLVFISRIWGGREHNVRLFGALSKLDCKKYLYAILTQESDKQYANRLANAGVRCGFELVPLEELWKLLSRARLVVLRAGKHLCVPWRMLDLLAMGACVMVDADPFPQWPVPLERDRNYLSLGISRPVDTSPGPIKQYERIPDIVSAILGDTELQEEIRRNNARYFDEYASPIAVGEYIVRTLMEPENA